MHFNNKIKKILLNVPLETTDILITISKDNSRVVNCNLALCMMDDARSSFDQLQRSL